MGLLASQNLFGLVFAANSVAQRASMHFRALIHSFVVTVLVELRLETVDDLVFEQSAVHAVTDGTALRSSFSVLRNSFIAIFLHAIPEDKSPIYFTSQLAAVSIILMSVFGLLVSSSAILPPACGFWGTGWLRKSRCVSTPSAMQKRVTRVAGSLSAHNPSSLWIDR